MTLHEGHSDCCVLPTTTTTALHECPPNCVCVCVCVCVTHNITDASTYETRTLGADRGKGCSTPSDPPTAEICVVTDSPSPHASGEHVMSVPVLAPPPARELDVLDAFHTQGCPSCERVVENASTVHQSSSAATMARTDTCRIALRVRIPGGLTVVLVTKQHHPYNRENNRIISIFFYICQH